MQTTTALALKQALNRQKAFQEHNLNRLKPGQTMITLDSENEVVYKAKAKDTSVTFKPLSEQTMALLEKAVSHAKLKEEIKIQVEKEKGQTKEEKRQKWQMSSSEDLYSDRGGEEEDSGEEKGGYQLPKIDPNKLKIVDDSD